jgi:hypothetical protein
MVREEGGEGRGGFLTSLVKECNLVIDELSIVVCTDSGMVDHNDQQAYAPLDNSQGNDEDREDTHGVDSAEEVGSRN